MHNKLDFALQNDKNPNKIIYRCKRKAKLNCNMTWNFQTGEYKLLLYKRLKHLQNYNNAISLADSILKSVRKIS